ncbi:MAG TPA: hypothetical protein VMF69_09590 [Gemmataceae bacterium]|nr:hypothetical protein [Gemmataceae bacterium]
MRPFRGSLWCFALAALAMADGSAGAAWNNVFQVCCHNCRSSNYVAVPAPVAAPPAVTSYNGCQQCTTRYIQRCYYQPVTTYRQSCYMEPVTTYRTSYYYEPCTSVRYSCYYDPCTCRYQQVAQPVTTYRLRSQCCPVTSYLQRCCLQPVTTYQQMTYYEPQTTCCTTTIGAPVAALPYGASVAPGTPQPAIQGAPMVPAPGVQGAPMTPAPGVYGGQTGAPPAVSGQPNVPQPGVQGGSEPMAPEQAMPGATSNNGRIPPMPNSNGSSYRQPRLQAPVPAQPAAPAPNPRVRFDRITSTPRHNTEGQVVRADRLPQAGIKVIFVCADEQGGRQSATTDGSGRFQTTLTAGNWLIYTQDAAGRLVYQQKVRIATTVPTAPLTLVSR